MPAKNPETWLCPLCSLETMKYGATCPEFRSETCKHMDELNINGLVYLRLKTQDDAKGLGISEIAKGDM